MLDDDTSRLLECGNTFERGVRVGNIVERQCFALDFSGCRQCAGCGPLILIKSGALMRIFAVAHGITLFKLEIKYRWKITIAVIACQVVGDYPVIARCVAEGSSSQTGSGVGRNATQGFKFTEHDFVVFTVNHHGHRCVILCASTQHGRSANIDAFNCVDKSNVWRCDHLFKWV